MRMVRRDSFKIGFDDGCLQVLCASNNAIGRCPRLGTCEPLQLASPDLGRGLWRRTKASIYSKYSKPRATEPYCTARGLEQFSL